MGAPTATWFKKKKKKISIKMMVNTTRKGKRRCKSNVSEISVQSTSDKIP